MSTARINNIRAPSGLLGTGRGEPSLPGALNPPYQSLFPVNGNSNQLGFTGINTFTIVTANPTDFSDPGWIPGTWPGGRYPLLHPYSLKGLLYNVKVVRLTTTVLSPKDIDISQGGTITQYQVVQHPFNLITGITNTGTVGSTTNTGTLQDWNNFNMLQYNTDFAMEILYTEALDDGVTQPVNGTTDPQMAANGQCGTLNFFGYSIPIWAANPGDPTGSLLSPVIEAHGKW